MKKLSALILFILASFMLAITPAFAAQPAGNAYIRPSRMAAGVAPGSVLVVFTTSSAATTEATFRITLDAEWVSTTNFSTTAGNYTVSTASLPAGVTAMPGINTATSVTGNTIVFPVSAMAVSTTYGFYITAGLTLNPTASNTIQHYMFTADSGVVTLDEKTVAVPTTSSDQISITASVPPSFTFVLGSPTAALGTLSSSAISSGAGNAITITTNAGSGWNAWVRSANAGLTSTNVSYTVPTSGSIDNAVSTIVAGTEGYVLDVDLTTDAAGGGTVTLASEYNGTTTAQGGTLSTTFQSIASANGVTNGDIVTLVPRVAISGTTKAASDYADTLTVVGAGIF